MQLFNIETANSTIETLYKGFKIIDLQDKQIFYSQNIVSCNKVYFSGFEVSNECSEQELDTIHNKFNKCDRVIAIYSDTDELVGLGFYNYLIVYGISIMYERGIVLKKSVHRYGLSKRVLNYAISVNNNLQYVCGATHNPITIARYKRISSGEIYSVNAHYSTNPIVSILSVKTLELCEGFSNKQAGYIINHCNGVLHGRYQGLQTKSHLNHNEALPNIFVNGFSRNNKDALFCLVAIQGNEHE